MAASTKRLADIDRSKTEPIDFDDSKLGKVKPPLAPAEGFGLSSSELRNVFGMRPSAFGSLPRRIVIPDLKASAKADGHSVTGYLYIVEPVAWVPRVRHGTTIPLSVFKKPNVKEEQPVLESALNKPGVAAQLATNTAGAYVGTKAEPLTNNPIHSTATKAGLEVRDNLPPFPIHQLTVFPMLRVRALKQQRIDLQVNAAKKLTWTNTEKAGYWDKTVVTAKRLSSAVGSLQLHPLPLEGPEDLSKLLFILPVPRLLDSGELEVATLVSRSGWPDWYLYEENAWVNAPADKILMVAAPQNQTAFQAVTTWAPLTEPDDHCGTNGQESNGNKYTNNTGNNTSTNTSQSTKPQPTVQTDTNKDAGVPKTNTNTNTNNNINTNGNSLEPSKPKVGPVVDSTCEDTKPSNKPEVAVNPLPNTGNANTNTNINTNNSKPQNSKPEPITDSTPKTTTAVNSGSESKPCDTTKDKPLDGKAVPTNTNTNTNINGSKPEDSTPIKNDSSKSNPTSKTTPTVTNPVFDSKPHDNTNDKPTDGKAVLPNANTNTNTNTNNSISPKSKPDPIIESTPKTTPTVVNPGSDHKPCDATQGKPVNGKPIPASTDADINDHKPIPNTNTNANTNVNGPKPEDLNPINKDLPKTNPTPKTLQTAVNPISDSQTCGDGQDKPANDKPTSGKPVPTNTNTNTNTNINDTPAKAKPASDKPIDNKPVNDRPIPANTNTNANINDKPIPTNTNNNFNDKPVNDTPINGKPIPTNTNTNTNINGPKPEDCIPIKKDPPNTKPSLANTNDTKPVPTNANTNTNTNTNTNVNGKPVNTKPVPTNTNTNTNINGSKPEDSTPIKQDPPKSTPKVTPPPTTTNTNVNNNTNTNFNGNLTPHSWPFHGTIILRCPCCPPDTATITISPPPPKLV